MKTLKLKGIGIGSAGGSLPIYDGNEPSMTFEGNAYLLVPNTPEVIFTDGTNDKPIWISFYAKLNLSIYGTLCIKPLEFACKWQSTGQNFNMVIYTGTTSNFIGKACNLVAYFGSWHHFVFYYDGSKSSTGIKIYVDKVSQALAEYSSGTFTGIIPTVNPLTVNAATSSFTGEMVDFRIGGSVLTSDDVTDLYNHSLNGNEIVHYPMSEGFGSVIHNVKDNNDMTLHAKIINDTNNLAWNNTQDFFTYNHIYGATKINDYLFPNRSDKTSYFVPMYGDILAGQSNASGRGLPSDLIATIYELPYNVPNKNVMCYNATLNKWISQRLNTYQLAGSFGIDYILGVKSKLDNKQQFIIKRSLGSSGLASGSSTPNWNVATVGGLYDTLKADLIAQCLQIFENGREPFIRSFIWIQGEQDTTNAAYYNAYEVNLQALLDGLIGVTHSGLLFIVVQLGETAYPAASGVAIRLAESNVVSNNVNTTLINTSDAAYIDGIHYTGTYMVNIGERVYADINNNSQSGSYLNKIFPDGWTKITYRPV